MKKLFFFDIDGTLIECEKGIYEIPENTKKALDKLKRNGNDVFLLEDVKVLFLMKL